MGERLNIWGLTDCNLPSGNLCDACCNVKAIYSDWGNKKFQKLPHTLCPLMLRQKVGQGCAVYGMAPKSCEAYHCDGEDSGIKLELIRFARQTGLVTTAEAEAASSKVRS